jgi:dienelactone hydrolase
MLAAADAEQLTIPHMVLASNGEDAEIVKQYKAIIDGEGKTGEVRIPMLSLILCLSKANIQMKVETYATMHHGWMGARANLSNADNLKEYERGYNQLAGFFTKYL